MLVQFTVSNFLSFAEETTFGMMASADQKLPEQVEQKNSRPGGRVLRLAAIYGANASGKSNLIKAIEFARRRIVRGSRPGQRIPNHPFKLGTPESSASGSKFQFVFWAGEVRYDYGFVLDAEQIQEEWLFGSGKEKGAQEKTYFQRTTSAEHKAVVEPGSKLIGKSKRQRQLVEFLAEGTRANQLFLSECFERNVKEVEAVREWFENTLIIVTADANFEGLALKPGTDETFRLWFAKFLRAAGTGISGVRTSEEPLDPQRHLPGISAKDLEEILEKAAAIEEDTYLLLAAARGERQVVLHGGMEEPTVVTMQLDHQAADGRQVALSMDEESEGTQRLMHLLPAIFELCDRGRVVVVDELERRLHPLLSRLILQAAVAGSKTSQLIFTTHDSNLLDQELIRRDAIWFVEKNHEGASQLYSLGEYKIRPDLKLEKGYLNGRFGAVPFIGDSERLGLFSDTPGFSPEVINPNETNIA